MADILSDLGIGILEEEIDDVIFQTNEFLCDATFTGSQGPFWWLLVVSVFLHFPPFATLCKPTTCEILFRETNPKRDKNGTKSQENKIKNASSPTSLVVDFSFLCKGTILSRENKQNPANMLPIKHLYYMCIFRKILQVLHAQTCVAYFKDLLKSVLCHLYTTVLPPMRIALEQCTTHLPLSAMRKYVFHQQIGKNATWHNDRTKRHIQRCIMY